jgi:transposase
VLAGGPARWRFGLKAGAHARRKFFDAAGSDPARSHAVLAHIAEVYRVEHEATDLGVDAAGRKALRQDRTRPVLERLKGWLDGEWGKLLPKSPIASAAGCALSNWAALMRFLEDGELDPDNNEAERAIRPIAVGRPAPKLSIGGPAEAGKNWLFCGSSVGGRTASVHLGICESCNRNGVNPWAYMRDVLVRVSLEPASSVRELLPDRWRPALALAPPPAPDTS